MSHCLDSSNYDQATFNAQCFKDAGVTEVIVGCQDPVIARQQIAALRSVGILVRRLYGFDYFTAGTGIGNGDIIDAILIAHEVGGIERIYVDCEIDNTPDDPADRNAEVRACVADIEAAGFEASIYTAPWWWVPHHANTAEFSHLSLWFANYGANDGQLPPIHELGFLSFGGWTQCDVHQYTSTLNICGRGRDANYVFEEEDMADPRVDALIAAMGGQPAIDDWNTKGNSLILGFTIEQQKLGDTAASLETHIANAAAGVGGDVADHKHSSGTTGGIQR